MGIARHKSAKHRLTGAWYAVVLSMHGGSTFDNPHEIRVGAHLFRWEPPDVGYIAYCGNLDAPLMGALSEQSRRFTVGQPCVFLIVDMAQAGKISAEARQLSAKGSVGLNLRGIAVIGAAAPLRMIARLVSRAVDLLSRNTDNPTRFFETESEARAWISTRRSLVRETDPTRSTSP